MSEMLIVSRPAAGDNPEKHFVVMAPGIFGVDGTNMAMAILAIANSYQEAIKIIANLV